MEESTEMAKQVAQEPKPGRSFRNCRRPFILIIIACILGYGHYAYVARLFENDRNFSHLSTLEREMSLQTEMGFYYYFYKTVVEEPQFVTAMTKLMYNKMVEYPREVNAFNRFNIHPEVILGSLYRYCEPWLNATWECHWVNRGPDLPPVESCIGIGEPIMFYLEAVWVLAGLTVSSLFLFSAVLSNSIIGAILAVINYAANHASATRVMWAPNERENFCQPFLLLQMCLLSVQLRKAGEDRAALPLQIAICMLNCICLLFWQFTQFIFLTQTAIFLIMDQLRIIDLRSFSIFLHAHFGGLHMAILLLQGNDMLKSSLYASFFLVVSVYCIFFSGFRLTIANRIDLLFETWLVILRISLIICLSFWVKKLISGFLGVEEDTHVWEILESKFSTFKNFHTLLYTCSAVFDFMPLSEWSSLTVSGLIPFNVFAIYHVVNKWYSNARDPPKKPKTKKRKLQKKESVESGNDSGIENITENKRAEKGGKTDATDGIDGAVSQDLNVIDAEVKSKTEKKNKDKWIKFLENLSVDAAIFYNVSQMVVFGFLAGIVMRLKLLFVPHLCIVSSLVMKNDLYCVKKKTFTKIRDYLLPLVLVFAVRALYNTYCHETAIFGEFNAIHQEELLNWIIENTRSDAVIAASMPLTASILLSTGRAVPNHPHYEHVASRERNYVVYKMYGKFSPDEVYHDLNKLKVTHLVVEKNYCFGKSSQGCTFENIWDLEAPSLKNQRQLCETLLSTPVDHLYRLFDNKLYSVFSVHDYSVRYTPRARDS